MKKNKSSTRKLLVIDDEENMRHMLASVMTRAGYRVTSAVDGSQGLKITAKEHFDCILCDLKMPEMDGIGFLQALRAGGDETTVVMMSAYATVDTAVEAMKQGAFDFVTKPFKSDEVLIILERAEEHDRLRLENKDLKQKMARMEATEPFGGVIGTSHVMRELIEISRKVAVYDTTVLVTGESGTGKELIARGIHQHSARLGGPFVAINCGSVPQNLLESEFFGYKKGAFTGADADRKGLFETAGNGTLFLDEVGELPLDLQVKLLRVLQEREIRPVGDQYTRKVNVRVVAATAVNLEKEVEKGRFRKDLFYRLNVVTLCIPPLRSRREDIPLLCDHFLDLFSRKMNVEKKTLSAKALALLSRQDWPGNVRELENVMERTVIFADKNVILPEDLPENFGARNKGRRLNDILGTLSLKQGQKIMEKRLISRVLDVTGGNKSKAAEILEISYPSLLAKIKEHTLGGK